MRQAADGRRRRAAAVLALVALAGPQTPDFRPPDNFSRDATLKSLEDIPKLSANSADLCLLRLMSFETRPLLDSRLLPLVSHRVSNAYNNNGNTNY